MLNYMIIFKECFKIAQLFKFKVYSFVTPFPNTEVLGWGLIGRVYSWRRKYLVESSGDVGGHQPPEGTW